MGVFNWFTQKILINEARRIAIAVREDYNSVKAENPNLSDTDLHISVLFDIDKFNNYKGDDKDYIKNCCQTIEGLCYMIAMDFGKLNGFMTFRLLQFTKYMDYYLYSSGFKKQTKEQKENILKTLNIYVKDWEKFTK